MKFKEVIIVDWYDKIITAVCKNENNLNYFCNLLAFDDMKDDKIYVCIELKYFIQSDIILNIVKMDKFPEEEEELLHQAFNMVSPNNKSFLIKTTDLMNNDFKVVKYTNDFNWNHDLFFIDYPITLEKSVKLDNWWKYFPEFN